jgi:hypothetical protein
MLGRQCTKVKRVWKGKDGQGRMLVSVRCSGRLSGTEAVITYLGSTLVTVRF